MSNDVMVGSETPMKIVMDILESRLCRLEATWGEVVGRLEPICRPADPEPACGDGIGGCDPARSVIVEKLYAMESRVEVVTEGLAAILDRLDT